MCKKKEKKPKKCTVKCMTCQFYNKASDFCEAKEIENCSKQVSTDFSQCNEFLVKESLIMF